MRNASSLFWRFSLSSIRARTRRTTSPADASPADAARTGGVETGAACADVCTLRISFLSCCSSAVRSARQGAVAALTSVARTDEETDAEGAGDARDAAFDHPVRTLNPFASYLTSRFAMPADTPRNN